MVRFSTRLSYLFEDEVQHQRIVETVFGIKNL